MEEVIDAKEISRFGGGELDARDRLRGFDPDTGTSDTRAHDSRVISYGLAARRERAGGGRDTQPPLLLGWRG
jgi:hypothetical protein